MKKFLARVAAVRAAKRFVGSYKCLTSNGHRRINGVINSLDKYVGVLKKDLNTDIDELIKFKDFVNYVKLGLIGFKSGTLSGFNEFEEYRTIERLNTFINRKGKI